MNAQIEEQNAPAAELDLAAALNALPRSADMNLLTSRIRWSRDECADVINQALRWMTTVYLHWTDDETPAHRPVRECFWGYGKTSAEADANVLTQIAHWMHL